MQYEYPIIQLMKIVDGDTLDIEIDQGFYDSTTKRFRLLGVWAPERGKPGWSEAQQFMQAWFTEHPGPLILSSFKTPKGAPLPDGSFGRWLAIIEDRTVKDNLNLQLSAYIDNNGWSNQK